jgi:hypothetical protein
LENGSIGEVKADPKGYDLQLLNAPMNAENAQELGKNEPISSCTSHLTINLGSSNENSVDKKGKSRS